MKWSIKRLIARQTTWLRKLANPTNPDDPKWIKRRLKRIESGIEKKERAKEQKDREKKNSRKP